MATDPASGIHLRHYWILLSDQNVMKNTTSPPTRPTTTGRRSTTRPKIISTRSIHEPASTRVSASTPPTPAHTPTHKPEATTFHPNETIAEVTEAPIHTPTDWNNTVTSSDNSWNTEAIPPRKLQQNQTKGFYVGLSIAALLLMLLVTTVVITSLVTFPVSKFGASQKKVVEQARGEDKIYIVGDTPNPEEES
ncbi:T-cell immunoglobulin and mucin domain-containing protein 2 [Apodemus speciosus]